MSKFPKRAVLALFIIALPLFTSANHSPLEKQVAKHKGDAKFLSYEIVYLDELGVTTVHNSGIDFIPFVGLPTFSGEILPAEYFGEYPLYFAGNAVEFKVHIQNTGRRTYKNLLVIAGQELLNTGGGTGELFTDPLTVHWVVPTLVPDQEVILAGEFFIPNGTGSGIDQTHLQIIHYNGVVAEESPVHGGQIIVDDSQAGIWCPTL